LSMPAKSPASAPMRRRRARCNGVAPMRAIA
jgi:hypothetical protein